MTTLVTGAAGFIGYHVSQRLLSRGETVVGLDNLNAYYDVSLKEARLARLGAQPGSGSSSSTSRSAAAWRTCSPGSVPTASFTWRRRPACATRSRTPTPTSTAISSGSRTSWRDAATTASSTSVYASSSPACLRRQHQDAVLRARQRRPPHQPLRRHQEGKRADGAYLQPIFSSLPTTGLRFFTVYGPWGRPDMALFVFTKAILEGGPIDVFNHGSMMRDFTYIDDIVEGVIRVTDKPATPNPAFDAARPDPATSNAPYRVLSTSATANPRR